MQAAPVTSYTVAAVANRYRRRIPRVLLRFFCRGPPSNVYRCYCSDGFAAETDEMPKTETQTGNPAYTSVRHNLYFGGAQLILSCPTTYTFVVVNNSAPFPAKRSGNPIREYERCVLCVQAGSAYIDTQSRFLVVFRILSIFAKTKKVLPCGMVRQRFLPNGLPETGLWDACRFCAHQRFLPNPCSLNHLSKHHAMKQTFIDLLRSTCRKGIDEVIDYLEKSGFFTAPASVSRHLSYEGGLTEHSLNVYRMASMLARQLIDMTPELASKLPHESVIIAALLHDVCKSNIYHPVEKWRKDEQGKWETYRTYDCDYGRFPVGHGEKSVIMLLRLGLELTNDEILAIRWHMGPWNLPMQSYEDKANISAASDRSPLTVIVQSADSLATHLLETDKNT